MKIRPELVASIGALFLCNIAALQAAPSEAELKMREQLRATMLQLRTAETERAALQAAQAENEQKVKTLTAQVESLTKSSSAAEKAAADQAAELTRMRELVGRWEAAHSQASQTAQAKEAERAKLAGENIVLKRRVADQQRRNAELFRIGNEILTRLEKFSVGDAIAAKEPFTGLMRVKLENLVQDYGDAIADQRIKPAER